jgi:hypothetical protein
MRPFSGLERRHLHHRALVQFRINVCFYLCIVVLRSLNSLPFPTVRCLLAESEAIALRQKWKYEFWRLFWSDSRAKNDFSYLPDSCSIGASEVVKLLATTWKKIF